MKKLALTFAIVLGLSLSSFAGGGIFQRGTEAEEETNSYNRSGYFNYYDIFRDGRTGDPVLPGFPEHDLGTNESAPLGGGVLLLIGFGAAYAAAKRRKE